MCLKEARNVDSMVLYGMVIIGYCVIVLSRYGYSLKCYVFIYFDIYDKIQMAKLDANIWGPHYWFFLFTTGVNYPETPNEVTRKKYYDFIQNFPLFIPDPEMSSQFIKLLDKYPITPYLDSRTSYIKWIHFIHNRINASIGKDEISLEDAMERYYVHYTPRHIRILDELKYRDKLLYLCIVVGLAYGAYHMYKH